MSYFPVHTYLKMISPMISSKRGIVKYQFLIIHINVFDLQGCTCHGVEPDETCLDCLRSKANIGRYNQEIMF